jgi:hypothetical protein
MSIGQFLNDAHEHIQRPHRSRIGENEVSIVDAKFTRRSCSGNERARRIPPSFAPAGMPVWSYNVGHVLHYE